MHETTRDYARMIPTDPPRGLSGVIAWTGILPGQFLGPSPSRLFNEQPDELLSAAIQLNLRTYDRLLPVYMHSAMRRLVEAPRWFHSLWPTLEKHRSLRVLELGSSDGTLTGMLVNLGHQVTAVEFAPLMALATRQMAPGALVIEDEFLSSTKISGGFDVVIASAFVHLFPPPFDLQVVEKVRSLLRPEGVAYFSTTINPCYTTGFEEKLRSGGTMRYRTRHTAHSFLKLLRNSGFRVQNYYEAQDRFFPEKTWGNWVVRKGGN